MQLLRAEVHDLCVTKPQRLQVDEQVELEALQGNLRPLKLLASQGHPELAPAFCASMPFPLFCTAAFMHGLHIPTLQDTEGVEVEGHLNAALRNRRNASEEELAKQVVHLPSLCLL